MQTADIKRIWKLLETHYWKNFSSGFLLLWLHLIGQLHFPLLVSSVCVVYVVFPLQYVYDRSIRGIPCRFCNHMFIAFQRFCHGKNCAVILRPPTTAAWPPYAGVQFLHNCIKLQRCIILKDAIPSWLWLSSSPLPLHWSAPCLHWIEAQNIQSPQKCLNVALFGGWQSLQPTAFGPHLAQQPKSGLHGDRLGKQNLLLSFCAPDGEWQSPTMWSLLAAWQPRNSVVT